MFENWKKMKKDEKIAYANCKIIKGFAIFIFGLLWMYFGATLEGFVQTLTIVGLLVILFGLVKRFSV